MKTKSGQEIYDYYVQQKTEYASIIRLLPYAVGNFENAYAILERCERENKRLYPYYPGIGRDTCLNEDIISTFEYIGSIIDGTLYMGPAKYNTAKNIE